MQTVKQLSVRLVNKPGCLAAVLAGMSKEKVNLIALSVMDSKDRSTIRFVPDDPALARSALDTLNIEYDATDVLLTEISNRTGSFRHVCERLATEHLNIDYAYGAVSSNGSKGGSLAVIKVNNLAKAQRVLSETGSNGQQRGKPVRRRPARTR